MGVTVTCLFSSGTTLDLNQGRLPYQFIPVAMMGTAGQAIAVVHEWSRETVRGAAVVSWRCQPLHCVASSSRSQITGVLLVQDALGHHRWSIQMVFIAPYLVTLGPLARPGPSSRPPGHVGVRALSTLTVY
jgi:hypothetical protein